MIRNAVILNSIHGITVRWNDVCILDKKIHQIKFKKDYLKELFEKEYGYKYPTPIILKERLKLNQLCSHSLVKLYNLQTVIALMRDLTIEATKRNIDVSSKAVYDVLWWEFFNKKHVTFKLLNSYKYNLDRDIEEDCLYSWFEAGGYHGESRIKVGLVISNLLVCLKDKEIALVCWERETDVMNKDVLKEWFGEIIDDFNKSYLDMNDAILKYMKKAQDICDEVECRAKDKSILLYQDPIWETFWIERGDIRTAKNLILENRHPGSHKDLLATLDDTVIENAIIKNVIYHILNMDKIMKDWKKYSGPQRKLTPISYMLVVRWWEAHRANDENEKKILFELAKGKMQTRLQEALKNINPENKDYKLITDYISYQLELDMNLFLKNHEMDIILV